MISGSSEGCLFCGNYTEKEFCSAACREAWWMDMALDEPTVRGRQEWN